MEQLGYGLMGIILCLGKAMAPPISTPNHQPKNSDMQTSRIQINAGMSHIKTACGQHDHGKKLSKKIHP